MHISPSLLLVGLRRTAQALLISLSLAGTWAAPAFAQADPGPGANQTPDHGGIVGARNRRSEPKRKAVPSRNACRVALREILGVYHAELELTGAENRSTTAARLLEDGVDEHKYETRPAISYRLLELSAEQAARAVDRDLVERILEQWTIRFRVRRPETKIIAWMAEGVRDETREGLPSAIRYALGRVEDALDEKDWPAAHRCLNEAQPVLQLAAEIPALKEQRAYYRDAAQRGIELTRKAKRARKAEPTSEPAEASASKSARSAIAADYGRYLCFIENEWEAGLEQWQRASESDLRELAEAEARWSAFSDSLSQRTDDEADPLRAETLLELGNRWFDAGTLCTHHPWDQHRHWARAAHHYRAGLDAGLDGIRILTVHERIKLSGARNLDRLLEAVGNYLDDQPEHEPGTGLAPRPKPVPKIGSWRVGVHARGTRTKLQGHELRATVQQHDAEFLIIRISELWRVKGKPRRSTHDWFFKPTFDEEKERWDYVLVDMKQVKGKRKRHDREGQVRIRKGVLFGTYRFEDNRPDPGKGKQQKINLRIHQ